MQKSKIEETVEKIAEKICEGLESQVEDVEFVKEGADWILRVYIDKEEGITIDDCEAVSKRLSEELDATDPIPQNYMLEVSSPGLERPLRKDRDFVRFTGRQIEVHTFAPLRGKKRLEGILKDYVDSKVYLEIAENDIIEINRSQISKANLMIDFDF